MVLFGNVSVFHTGCIVFPIAAVTASTTQPQTGLQLGKFPHPSPSAEAAPSLCHQSLFRGFLKQHLNFIIMI